MTSETTGWNVNQSGDGDWAPWGEGGRARAKVLAAGDGYMFMLVEADAGYTGTPHEHTNTEFAYVLDGRIRNQGHVMEAGGAFVAEAGSMHADFEALVPSRYVSIFKL